MVCTFWHKNSWMCSTIGLFLDSGSHKHYAQFLDEFDWSEVFLGDQTWRFCVHPSPQWLYSKHTKGYSCSFFPSK